MTHPEIVVTDAPDPQDIAAVMGVLVRYNDSQAGPSGRRPLAVLARDPATGETLGGLTGRIGYDWLFIEFLALPDAWRNQGFGSELMRQAEAFAREHGCTGIWLDTFEFQARGFYEKLGFRVFGEIEDNPSGRRRFFLKKRLDGAAEASGPSPPQHGGEG